MEIAENNKITVKVFVKSSYVFDVTNYTAIRGGSRVGEAIKSPSFYVGGCPFTILFYPQGRSEAAHGRGEVSLFIMNESPKEVETAYSLHILEQIQPYAHPPDNIGFCYDDRWGFREVLTLEPDYQTGIFHFEKRDYLEDPDNCFLVGDCFKIRAIVGVFIDHTFGMHRQPIDRYIFFQLEMESESGKRKRYFAEESVVVSQCPRLLPYNYRCYRDVIIPDIKYDVFEAVLWFIYNHELDSYDREEICKSNPSEPDSYASRMLAAADRFGMKRFRRQCQSIISSNASPVELIRANMACSTKLKLASFEKLLGGVLDSSNNRKDE